MTEILGKSILVRVSASFELVRVPVIRSRLYAHAALCYSRTKLSSHGWIFCFLSCKTRSLTRFSIVCSQFSILYSCRNREENRDSQWTVNLLLNGTVPVLPFVTLSYPLLPCVTLRYPALPSVTLCYSLFPCVTLCYPVLLFVTLCYPLLLCVSLCYLVLPCVTLGYSVLPCATVLPFVSLCYPVLPSVTLCFPLLFVTLCYPLLGFVALSLPRRRFKWSSFFIPHHKRLFSRKQHSFPTVLFAW